MAAETLSETQSKATHVRRKEIATRLINNNTVSYSYLFQKSFHLPIFLALAASLRPREACECTLSLSCNTESNTQLARAILRPATHQTDPITPSVA